MAIETRYILDSDGKVVNSILLDSEESWTPPPGLSLAPDTLTEAERGGSYDPGTDSYTAPPAPQDEDLVYKTEYEAAGTDSAKIEVIAKALGLQVDEPAGNS